MRWLSYVLGVLMSVAASSAAFAQSHTVVADSQSQFSCTQGQGGWQYGYFTAPFTSQDFQPETREQDESTR